MKRDTNKETCRWPRCGRTPVLTYMGRPLCSKHWNKLCEVADDEVAIAAVRAKLEIKFGTRRAAL